MNSAGEKLVSELSQEGDKRPRQARARLFTMLAFLWIFPSLGALVIIGFDFFHWFDSQTILEGLGRIRFEQWIALGLLALHALFVVFAVRFRRGERSGVPAL